MVEAGRRVTAQAQSRNVVGPDSFDGHGFAIWLYSSRCHNTKSRKLNFGQRGGKHGENWGTGVWQNQRNIA